MTVGIVADTCRVCDGDAGACEVDGGVECVAADREPIAGVLATREFDHAFADRDDILHARPRRRCQ